MARPEKFTREQVAAALEDSRGLRTIAARNLGCSPNTVSRYLDLYPELADIIAESDTARLERAFSKLDEQIDKGRPWAIQTAIRYAIDRERLRIADKNDGNTAQWRIVAERWGVNADELLATFRQAWRERLASRGSGVLEARPAEDSSDGLDDDTGE